MIVDMCEPPCTPTKSQETIREKEEKEQGVKQPQLPCPAQKKNPVPPQRF